MKILGIETSCDETAVAWVEEKEGRFQVIDSLVSSQIRLHERFGGVVPEIATREHLKNLPALTRDLILRNGLDLHSVDAIAVTAGPGLPTALLVGTSYAKGLGVALGKPVHGINHLEGHLFSPFFHLQEGVSMEIPFPMVGLVVSGGHTLLIEIKGWKNYRKMGGTVDDAAGEAFDKVARLLGLPYPGGPQIEKESRDGDENAIEFPQSFPERDNFNFSFSGLKTSVRYFLEKNPDFKSDLQKKKDLAASFQKAVVEVLVRKSVRACQFIRSKTLVVAGGVACNGVLRKALELECRKYGIALHIADPRLCTDNAAMIACVAAARFKAGIEPNLNVDFDPNMKL
ncbi:MAG: tRNA (adenosine(37)-N6)-threonylcarbamoyltransferase complex transferase subunit TsaD [Verrucomicrobiota bacterium]